MNKATAALLVLVSMVLLYSLSENRKLESREQFWRRMYIDAEKDAGYKVCLDYDDAHVICQRGEQ